MAVAVSRNFSKDDLQIDSGYMGEMLRLTYHQGNVNQSHKRMSPYPSEKTTVKTSQAWYTWEAEAGFL